MYRKRRKKPHKDAVDALILRSIGYDEKAYKLKLEIMSIMDDKLRELAVKLIKTDKKRFLDLLLLADESENMIDKYLERGDLFALYDGGLKSVCVVTRESNDTCELKNIATYEKYHGQGYGSRLIQYIIEFYKGRYNTMLVGTGDITKSLRFYQNNGFEVSHRVKNFFTDNYDHPMFEDGVQLVDMVYLKREW